MYRFPIWLGLILLSVSERAIAQHPPFECDFGQQNTKHRACIIDLHVLAQHSEPCNFSDESPDDPTLHDAFKVSHNNREHMKVTNSEHNHPPFRIRRIVPLSANDHIPGAHCPEYPFFTSAFGGGAHETGHPKASAVGCFYKLEIQTTDTGASTGASGAFPDDNDDDVVRPPNHPNYNYKCYDPHFQIEDSQNLLPDPPLHKTHKRKTRPKYQKIPSTR